MKRFRLFFLLFFIPLVVAQTSTEVEITAEPSHHIALENGTVRVFKVEVAPKRATLLHRHRHDYFFVSLGDSHISNEVQGKQPVDASFRDAEVRFTEGNFAHIARDLSDKPFRNVTIELLQDDTLRRTPSPRPTERGEVTYAGGRSTILMVKDGVRVSDVTLDPGATIPSHHHDGPHLVVALTDLDLRSDLQGRSSSAGEHTGEHAAEHADEDKAGDVIWVPGGYSHTLTNEGKTPAHFLTFEF